MAKHKRDNRGGPPRPWPTRERLAACIQDELDMEHTRVVELARRAYGGYYDRFESPLGAPEAQLLADLREYMEVLQERNLPVAAVEALIASVIDGDFDASKAESDAWMQRAGTQLLAEGLSDMTAREIKKAQVGTADLSSATYLTRRLTEYFRHLKRDSYTSFNRADLMMALHNSHVWSLLEIIDADQTMTPEVRDGVLKSAVTTFEMRMKREFVSRKKGRRD